MDGGWCFHSARRSPFSLPLEQHNSPAKFAAPGERLTANKHKTPLGIFPTPEKLASRKAPLGSECSVPARLVGEENGCALTLK